jgi:hypothetical protein
MIKFDNHNILRLVLESLIRFHIKQIFGKLNNSTLNQTALSMLSFEKIYKSMFFNRREDRTYDATKAELFTLKYLKTINPAVSYQSINNMFVDSLPIHYALVLPNDLLVVSFLETNSNY